MKGYQKKVILFAILLAFLLALIFFLLLFSPTEIVAKIGITNAYLLLFAISFFGGFSSGGSIYFLTTLGTFAAGGLNPLVLGLIAGTALATGDIIMFTIARKGRELVVGKWRDRIDRFSRLIERRTKGFIPVAAYLYLGFTPFPSDIMILSLAAIDYPPKKAYLPIILGDLTFATLFSIFVSQGIIAIF